MITSKINYRILYGDTDKAGVVYYGTYPRFYEMGRTELIREQGLAYKELEEMGVIMPVRSMNAKYYKTLEYDELITIETTMKEMPEAKAVFYTNIFKENGELANSAEVTLVYIDMETFRIRRAPAQLLDVLKAKGLK